ncbi:hypothetical protein HFP89_01765 [Wenzhouxiangella sp. XN79A]|uniref:hypothetical protein n=1 Tax=Wenzhouxiangella sp. XN79A TaxID=2724193 RepID=UPI00144A8CE2|nr:hypothetical protein [Wenzhouxiangella sp. XN79A]NKI33890.1 hypothetical protein [Wenzhouxiangella sp. XN79A]
MTRLHPSVESIEAGYAAWLGRPVRPVASEVAVDDRPLPGPGPSTGAVPHAVADAIRRQAAARPHPAAPDEGLLVCLSAPADGGAEPQYPVVVALDRVDPSDDGRWFGWLVGAHADYAGDRDLVLDAEALAGEDPVPAAGMVLCWASVAVRLGADAPVLHRLSADALACVRALAAGAAPSADAPAPGRMCTRRIDGRLAVTGTPYTHDDPRTPYLELTRALARAVSQPSYDDAGRLRRPDPDGPER